MQAGFAMGIFDELLRWSCTDAQASVFFSPERSIPVIRKTHQLKKEEPRDKIEVYLDGCNNPIKPEVHYELYTE